MKVTFIGRETVSYLASWFGKDLYVLVTDIGVEILFWESKDQPETVEKEILCQIRWIVYSADVDKQTHKTFAGVYYLQHLKEVQKLEFIWKGGKAIRIIWESEILIYWLKNLIICLSSYVRS